MGKSAKKTKQAGRVEGGKHTKISDTLPSLFDMYPIWSFSRCDFENDKWGFNSHRQHIWDLLMRLNAFEGQSWGQIFGDTSGRKSNTKNHPIKLDRICKQAQERAEELKLDEFDEIYSLSLTGERRLWGILSKTDGVFSIVWYDEHHDIYPVGKLHT